jgi:hypothetical protein
MGGGVDLLRLDRLAVIDKKTRALSFRHGQGFIEIDRLLTTNSNGAVIVVRKANQVNCSIWLKRLLCCCNFAPCSI